jgi:hypothetical protein
MGMGLNKTGVRVIGMQLGRCDEEDGYTYVSALPPRRLMPGILFAFPQPFRSLLYRLLD